MTNSEIFDEIEKEEKMRNTLIDAVKKHAEGIIAKHKANVEIILTKTVAVAEHPDIIETIEKELDIIAKYNDQLEILKKYFK
jgi:vacuolar-type H+-ATPase subunit H